jgi:hypothetical protein
VLGSLETHDGASDVHLRHQRIRVGYVTGRVPHVRWALVDAQMIKWLAEPKIAPVIDVLEAISAGDQVFLLLAAAGQSEFGRKVMRVSYNDGAEGIEIDAQTGAVRGTLSDMQRI